MHFSGRPARIGYNREMARSRILVVDDERMIRWLIQ